MQCLWIRAAQNGQSYFADVAIPLRPVTASAGEAGVARAAGERSAPVPAQSLAFRRSAQVEAMDFHPAPRRQLIVLFSGTLEFECSDGTSRRATPGDIVLVDDTTGIGHKSRELDGPISNLTVQVPPDFDLATWFGVP